MVVLSKEVFFLKTSNVSYFRLLHSIKNHVSSLSVAAALLEPAVQKEPYLRYMSILKREIAAIQSLLQSRDDSSKYEYVSLAQIINELKEDFALRCQGKHIQTNLAIYSPGLIRCNRWLVRDAFYNVWENALDAMGDSGSLSITIWQDKNDSDGSMVHVSFADTGPGISQEILQALPRLFLTTKKGGLGLGLSIAQAVAVSHGGSMEINSAPTGTTVTFSFPVNAIQEQTQ